MPGHLVLASILFIRLYSSYSFSTQWHHDVCCLSINDQHTILQLYSKAAFCTASGMFCVTYDVNATVIHASQMLQYTDMVKLPSPNMHD